MTNLDALLAWLLGRLGAEIRQDHPEVAAAFDENPPGSEGDLPGWAARLDFPPVEPWVSRSAAVVNVQLGLEELSFAVVGLRDASDGRAAWFFVSVSLVTVMSCLERLDFLVKRSARGAHPLIMRETQDVLLAATDQVRQPHLVELRHSFAHGAHQSLSQGWFGAPKRERLWELMALSHESGEGLSDSFLSSGIERRAARYEPLARLAEHVAELAGSTAARLLDSAK